MEDALEFVEAPQNQSDGRQTTKSVLIDKELELKVFKHFRNKF